VIARYDKLESPDRTGDLLITNHTCQVPSVIISGENYCFQADSDQVDT
jgi:hypothetical protein